MKDKGAYYHFTQEEEKRIAECLAEGIFRIIAEWYLVHNKNLPPEYEEIEIFSRYRRPTKWRLNVWKILLNTAFKDIDKFKPEHDVKSCAKIMGMFETCCKCFDVADFEDDEPWPELDKAFESLGIPDSEPKDEDEFDALAHIMNFDRFSKLVAKESPEELGEVYKNYGEGLQMVSEVDSKGNVRPTKGTTFTPIYFSMLMLGDFLQELPTTEKAYDCLKEFMGDSMPQDLGDFQRACTRIGFVGAYARRRKQRVNRQARKLLPKK